METRYQQMQSADPDLDAIANAYDELNRDFDRATGANDRIAVVRRWDGLRRTFGTWAALVGDSLHWHLEDLNRLHSGAVAEVAASRIGTR